MKQHGIYIILIALLAILGSCEANFEEELRSSDVRANGIPTENEMVFDLYINIESDPVLEETDTLWMSLSVLESIFKDKISEQGVYIPLDESKYYLQFKIVDLLFNETPLFNVVVPKGKIVDISGNIISLSFGYPSEKPELKAGIKMNETGRYAISLINFPNPTNKEHVNNACISDCENYWYDMLFYLDDNKSAFIYEAFINYHFNLTDRLTNNFDASSYLDESIYDDAVFSFIVK